MIALTYHPGKLSSILFGTNNPECHKYMTPLWAALPFLPWNPKPTDAETIREQETIRIPYQGRYTLHHPDYGLRGTVFTQMYLTRN